MKIALACDHAGFPLKPVIEDTLKAFGHELIDCGTDSPQPVDYPDIVEKACRLIQLHQAERAILICGSGVGAAITANKIKGVYACVCHDAYSAAQGVEHDNMNALCLGARIIGIEIAKACTTAFLAAQFSTEERHRRRVSKIQHIEQEG